MTNTSYLNLFPVSVRRRPVSVRRAATAETKQEEATQTGASFSKDRVDRAFDLMSSWNSKSSASESVELTALVR